MYHPKSQLLGTLQLKDHDINAFTVMEGDLLSVVFVMVGVADIIPMIRLIIGVSVCSAMVQD